MCIFLTALSQPSQARLSEEQLTERLEDLSLRDRIGQLLMLGFYGTETKDLNQVIKTYHPGFVVAFSRNIRTGIQVAELNYSAQKQMLQINGIPLLIAVDQEGGAVARIKTRKPLASPWAIGRTGNPKIALKAGEITGRLLKGLGFQMNLAPVLDVASSGKDRFLGTRAFSDNPQKVSEMAVQYAQGLHLQHVLATAKHFPGHGRVGEDSHLKLPIKKASMAELIAHDLVPYQAWIAKLPQSAVMMAHVAVQSLDPSGSPATFSQPIIQKLLREKLKFEGLVVSDDLDMGGAQAAGQIGERALKALDAGVDVLMVAWNRKSQKAIFESILKAVQTGRLTEQRLNESVLRILKIKEIYGDLKPKKATPLQIDRLLKDLSYTRLSDEVAKESFLNQLSLPQVTTIVVVSTETKLAQSFRGSFAKVHYRHPHSITAKALGELVSRDENSLIVTDQPSSTRLMKALKPEVKARTLIVTQPSHAPAEPEFLAIFNMGSYRYRIGEWLAEALTPTDRMPAEDQ